MKLADEMLPAMTSIATAMGEAYQEGGKLHAESPEWMPASSIGSITPAT